MAATTFKVINWSPNEVISKDKMDSINQNTVWLRDNSPRAYYSTPDVSREQGLRIASGRKPIPAGKNDSDTVTVHFKNLFASKCQPIITTGIVSNNQRKIFCVISGLGQLHPDNRGFDIHVNVSAGKEKNDKIKGFHVTWQALGYYTS